MKNIEKYYFFISFITFFFGVSAQQSKSFLYVEPNVSLSYDSNLIKIKDKFSNTLYNTDSYSLSYIPNSGYINIQAGYSLSAPSKKVQDSLVDLSIKMCNKSDNDTIKIFKKGIPFHYKDFSGFGFIIKGKKEKRYVISYYCFNYFDGGFCNFFYAKTSEKKISKYKTDEKIVKTIIDGITTYSRKEIEEENDFLIPKYTISVDSVSRPLSLDAFLNRTFYGKVNIKTNEKNKIVKVEVYNDYGSEIFKTQSDGQLLIDCYDYKKGKIVKKCNLVVLNKFGRQVRIPFDFEYINN
jgi:hypothetical protein